MPESPLLNPIYLAGLDVEAAHDRRNVGQVIEVPGRQKAADLLVKQRATPGLGVLIDPGAAWVAATRDQWTRSRYFVTLDTQLDVTLADADPNYPRKDLIVLRIHDQQFGDATSEAVVQVVQGVAASNPLRPAAPSGDLIQLAEVTVQGGSNVAVTDANIVDLRPGARLDRVLLQRALAGMALAGNLSAGGYKLTNLGTPTANGDAATKMYVDDLNRVLAAKDLTSNTAQTSGTLNIPALSMTFTLNKPRRVMFGFDMFLDSSGDRNARVIMSGARTLRRTLDMSSTVAESLSASRIVTLPAGTHTINTAINAYLGSTGAVWAAGSSSNPSTTFAIDLGAA